MSVTADRYPDQLLADAGKLFNILTRVTGVLRVAGMPDGFYQRILDDTEFRAWLVEQVKEKLGPNYEETKTQKIAREIMGKNFLGIPEVVEHFGAISPVDLLALQYVPFSEETLRACAKTHALIADVGLSLLNAQSLVCMNLFHTQDRYETYEFAHRTEMACWRLIRKTPVEDSFFKKWSEQRALVDDHICEIPSVRQVAYMIILNFLVANEQLFKNVYVRTSDVGSGGCHVSIGSGLDEHNNLYPRHDISMCGITGVSSARKPDLELAA